MAENWARIVHPWIMLAWSFLTLGIGLGSWWAYRVLGWGGFWFWDPVENASLLPWLSGTALLHANLVLKTRHLLKSWVLLLSIITFGLSLLGTFLVRSGVLTSVHSFASDPQRGIFILLFMALLLGGALALYALRLPRLTRGDMPDDMQPSSREGLIIINNLFVLTACATVLLGTLYPIAIEWVNGSRLTVGPEFFNTTFLPLMALPLFFAGLTPFMPWYRASVKQSLQQALPAAGAVAVVVIVVLAFAKRELLIGSLGLGLSAWLIACSLQWVRKHRRQRFAQAVFWGHLGIAVLLAGLTGTTLWYEERELVMGVGDKTQLGAYTVTYTGHMSIASADFVGLRALLDVQHDGNAPFTRLSPEHRINRIRGSATSMADIYSRPWHDIYAVIGDTSPDGNQTAVRLYYRPLMSLFWLGFLGMAAGGFLASMRRSI